MNTQQTPTLAAVAPATPCSSSSTPGPWSVTSGHKNIVYAQCVPIAMTFDGESNDWIPGKRFLYRENAEANASLIACAPEMLIVLEQIRDMVGGESENPDRDIARMQDLASAMAEKARGNSRMNA